MLESILSSRTDILLDYNDYLDKLCRVKYCFAHSSTTALIHNCPGYSNSVAIFSDNRYRTCLYFK